MSRNQDPFSKKPGALPGGLPIGPDEEPVIRVRIRDEDLRSITGGVGTPNAGKPDPQKPKPTPPSST